MAQDGFPFGILVFSDLNKFLTFLHWFQNLAYDMEVKYYCIYVYDFREFYEMVDMCFDYCDAYVICEINNTGANYNKLPH